MDTQNLIQHARARFDHEAAKRILKEKYEAKMLFAYNDGMWRAGPELLTTLSVCPDDQAVLLDLYDNPIMVIPQELTEIAQRRWQEQMNAWLVEYNETRKKR